MKIVVMGSGAIGSLYGGLLSIAYPGTVTLVARPPHVDAIRDHGLKIRGVMGDHTIPINAVEDASSIESADVVLITTKTYDTGNAVERIRHLVENGAYVIIVQNGIGTELLVSETLNSTKVLRATTCMGALITAPGEVTITGDGITELGSHYTEHYDFVETITDMMIKAGLNARASENIEGVVWTKTIVNCGINPVGALTGMTNGQVYGNPLLRKLVIQLVEETAEVASALGIELTTEDPVRYTLGTAKATSANTNSMLQDILAQKQTEIDFITGAVITLAKDLGINTPLSESLYALVKAIESKYLESGQITSDSIFSVEDLLSTITPHETSS
ncbi:MAG: ketopantoate reductase family protein [Candidatus Thorarchaeota archaeon]